MTILKAIRGFSPRRNYLANLKRKARKSILQVKKITPRNPLTEKQ